MADHTTMMPRNKILIYKTQRPDDIGATVGVEVSCIKNSYEYITHIILIQHKMQKSIRKYVIHDEKELDNIDIQITQ